MPTKKTTKKVVKKHTIDDVVAEIDVIVKHIDDLADELKEAKANLEVVNSNGQWACDKIEQMELKLSQVAGRLGL